MRIARTRVALGAATFALLAMVLALPSQAGADYEMVGEFPALGSPDHDLLLDGDTVWLAKGPIGG